MPPGGAGHYFIARLDGRDAAAIADARRRPVAWNTYVAVDDADASCALAGRGRGDDRRRAVGRRRGRPRRGAARPRGATFRLWQARRRLGAQVVNEPGAWNFSDLHTADPAAAEAFYGGVFGWEFDDLGVATLIAPPRLRRPPRGDDRSRDPRAPGSRVGAARVRGRDRLAGPAPCRRGAALARHLRRRRPRRGDRHRAERLGGTVLAATDTQWTREALVRDPQGGVFTLSQFVPPER